MTRLLKGFSQSLTASNLFLLFWLIFTLGQQANAEELNVFTKNLTVRDRIDLQINEAPAAQLPLASKQKNSSFRAKLAEEECPILTEPIQEAATASEYTFSIPIRVINHPVSVKVNGSTVLSSEEIETIITQLFQPQERQSLTLTEFNAKLEQVSQQITQLYLNRGYFTSQARILDRFPRIANRRIIGKIDTIEGRLVKIEVEERERLNLSYICSRIGLGVGIPLNLNQLEDQLRLLRVDPLFETLEADLSPTGKPGESILVIRVTEADPFFGYLGTDNYSPPSVGSVRFGGSLGYRNVTGLGDTFAATYYRSNTGGSNTLDVIYQVPLNPMNGTLLLRVAPESREVTQPPFDELDIEGEKELYEIIYRQPLVRTPREEFALSLGFNYQNDETTLLDRPFSFTFGSDDGESRTRVIQFSQDYINRDENGAWSLRSQFSFGTGLFDATANDDSIPDGQFFSWLFQVQRIQLLGRDNLLIVQGDLQLTPDPLLPNQQFLIGGGRSVRGYRQNARFGDNGLRFSIEDQITLTRNVAGDSSFLIAPFVDIGYVWNVADNPNELPDQQFLIGAGLGLLWDPLENFRIRLDYGYPFIDVENRGNNIQDDGLYFSVYYGF